MRKVAGLPSLVAVIATSVLPALAGSRGTGYIAKVDETKIYNDSKGEKLDAKVKKGFPVLAFSSSNVWFSGGQSSTESISDGRAHVRYLAGGKDGRGGDNTAWIDPSEWVRFSFDCCGNNACPGVEVSGFRLQYSTCAKDAIEEALAKLSSVSSPDADVEKLRLQLEIEKLKLEQERLKASAAAPSASPAASGAPAPASSAASDSSAPVAQPKSEAP